jgi:hypothetical protein
MDVNQKYCQSCHLISRNGFIITKIMSSQCNEVTKKFRSFSEPVQKISAEPTALTPSTESAPEPVFLPADNTRTPR